MIYILLMNVLTALLTFPDSAIGSLQIRRVNQIRIESSFKDLTSRAEILLPKNVNLFQNYQVKSFFRHGHRVEIKFGYDNNLLTEFTGYIIKVGADVPIKLICENEMWKLKQIKVNYVNNKTTLQELLKTICPGYEIDALEGVALGSLRLKQTTVAKVLEVLNNEFGLYSYMKGKTLVCGKYFSDDTDLASVKFNLDRIAQNSLQYSVADDLLVKVKGTSVKTNGDKIVFEFGEDGGDQLDLTYINIPTKEDLKPLVMNDYNNRKVDGFTGSFTSFGAPTIEHGMKAEISSVSYPERNGTYYVESVTKEFGFGGIRRVVSLNKRAV